MLFIARIEFQYYYLHVDQYANEYSCTSDNIQYNVVTLVNSYEEIKRCFG